jgi:hypothetical protein
LTSVVTSLTIVPLVPIEPLSTSLSRSHTRYPPTSAQSNLAHPKIHSCIPVRALHLVSELKRSLPDLSLLRYCTNSSLKYAL